MVTLDTNLISGVFGIICVLYVVPYDAQNKTAPKRFYGFSQLLKLNNLWSKLQ